MNVRVSALPPALRWRKKMTIYRPYMQDATIRESSKLRICVKVEVAGLGSPSLIVPTICVDVKQH